MRASVFVCVITRASGRVYVFHAVLQRTRIETAPAIVAAPIIAAPPTVAKVMCWRV